WGSGANDVWVVGNNGRILRWAGSSWAPAITGLTAFCYAVSGSGPNDVWVACTGSQLLHWNGTTWTPATLPTNPSGSYDIQALWAASATDVWAVGNLQTTLHYDGNA